MPQPEEDEETPVITGPDPRAWPAMREIWGLVEDLRVLDEVQDLMKGRIAQDGMSEVYEEAGRFLRASGQEIREQLSLVLLSIYGITPREDAGASPFSAAGKPRAFGADSSPPAGTLS